MFSVPKHDYCQFLYGRWADPLNENVSEAMVWGSSHCLLQKMVGWAAFEVSFHIMFKFKQFNKCFHFQNVTVNLSLLNCYSNSFFDLCLWVIPYRSRKQTSSLYLVLNKASDLVLSNDLVILKEKFVAKNILCIYGWKKSSQRPLSL